MNAKTIVPIASTALLLALAFPGTSLWPLVYIGLVPLLLWSRNKHYIEVFIGGMFAGIIFHVIVFSWFATLTYWAGGLALLGVALLFLVLSFFWGLVLAGKRFFEKWMPDGVFIAFPAMWVLMEYILNHILTGFGWGSLGYTQWNNLYVAQLASLGSVYAVSFFIVLINTLVYEVINNRNRIVIAAPAAIAVLALGIAMPLWGSTRMEEPDTSSSLRVGVIQPSFSLDVKWSREFRTHMLDTQERLTGLAVSEGAQLVVWPESALYRCLVDEIDAVSRIVQSYGIYLLTGSNHYESTGPSLDDDFLFFNSAFLIDPTGKILGRYDKRHLAPFGEYVPLQWLLPFVDKIVPQISDFDPGDRVTIFEIDGRRFAVLICFENSFPHVVRDAGKLRPHFLVQLTNDGWFGQTSQPEQDMAISVFRAIENGASLIRCTNTGISCFVDPWGRISGIVESYQGGTVFVRGISVETVSTVPHNTFYKSYGDLWVMACGVLFAIVLGACIYERTLSLRALLEG